MNWLKNLNTAIMYIDSHLDKEISYVEAARIACCSTNYFQRMFSYVTGISLSAYIRRRKMTQAAFELKSGNIKILDIALKYGYSSPTAFNRAFQQIHGIAPIEAKKCGTTLNAYPPIKLSVQVAEGGSMPYRIEAKKAFRAVGVRRPLSMDMDENIQRVPAFWQDILPKEDFSLLRTFSNQSSVGILGITAFSRTGEDAYYIAAETTQEAPPGMHTLEIPAATWVIFACDGHFKESVQKIFKRFLTEWLPFSGYTYAELPDIEVYPTNTEIPGEGHSEVWIAIKKEMGGIV